MTLGDIYRRMLWLVYGDSAPPTTTNTHFQATTEGIIANIHRKLQEDFNYWFMEETYGVNVPAYTRTLALPTDYKCEVNPVRILRFDTTEYTDGTAACSASTAVTGTSTAWDTDWTGKKYQISWDDATWYTILTVTSATALVLESTGPTASGTYTIRKCVGQVELSKLHRGESDKNAYDLHGYTSYPMYYDLYENQLHLFPQSEYDHYLIFKYYKYLDRPTAFNDHEDDLTDEASDLIIYMAAAMEERRRKEWESAQAWDAMAQVELKNLYRKHWQRTTANVRVPYIDV